MMDITHDSGDRLTRTTAYIAGARMGEGATTTTGHYEHGGAACYSC